MPACFNDSEPGEQELPGGQAGRTWHANRAARHAAGTLPLTRADSVLAGPAGLHRMAAHARDAIRHLAREAERPPAERFFLGESLAEFKQVRAGSMQAASVIAGMLYIFIGRKGMLAFAPSHTLSSCAC